MKKLICLLAAAALLVCCALPAFAEASGVSRADIPLPHTAWTPPCTKTTPLPRPSASPLISPYPPGYLPRAARRPVGGKGHRGRPAGDGLPRQGAGPCRDGEGQTAGAPVETDTEDGFYSIRIGDEDTWLTGVQTYELTFTYDIGDDRVAAYDELFYSLNGGQWDAPIEDFRFSFTFEKPLTQEQKGALALYSGSYGGKGNEAGVSGAWDGNTFSGAAGRTLYPGEAVTLYARLPEGYFTGRAHGPGMGVLGFCGRRRAAGRVHAAAGAVGPAQSAGGHARVYAAGRRVQRRGGLYHRQFGG